MSEFPVLTPTVVNMALLSGHFEEDRARQILQQMDENEKKTQETLAMITPKLSKYENLFFIISNIKNYTFFLYIFLKF